MAGLADAMHHSAMLVLLLASRVCVCVPLTPAPCCSFLLQVVTLLELLVASQPPSLALLRLLLTASSRFPRDTGWLAWLAPLAAGCACRCEPPVPVRSWAAVVALVRRVSGSAAAALAQHGVELHPWSRQLWQLHLETTGVCEARQQLAFPPAAAATKPCMRSAHPLCGAACPAGPCTR